MIESHSKYLSVISLFVVFKAVLVLSGCSEPTNIAPERLRPVESMLVTGGEGVLRDRVFTGVARAGQASRVSFKVAGTVSEVAVSVGDVLSKGDLIATLNPDTYNIEVQKSQASLAQAKAEKNNAESEYQRVRKLFANDNASRNDLDTAYANAESARANYNASEQSLKLARLNHQYTRLTADSACSVAQVDVEVSENVVAGTQVAVINCGDHLEVEMSVPESLISAFYSGLKGVVRFDAIPDKNFSAEVTEVGIAGNASTTYPVTVSLIDEDKAIRAGLAAEIIFAFADGDEASASIYVPPSAVGKDEKGAFVYVVEASDEQGVALTYRRSVQVGELNSSGLEIKAGLVADERIVTAGITAVRDGLRVRNR